MTDGEAQHLNIQSRTSLPLESVKLHQEQLTSNPQVARGYTTSNSAIQVVDGGAAPEGSTANAVTDDPPSSSGALTPATGRNVNDRVSQTQLLEDLVSDANYRLLLALLPEDGDLRPRFLSYVALARYRSFVQVGNINDIEEAIKLHREALSLRPVDHSEYSSSLSNLAVAIQSRYERFGDVDDINEAVTLHREALPFYPVGHSDRTSSLGNLAVAISIRYERTGDVNDINEAIALHREALSLLAVHHNDRSQSLNNLANALRARCKRFGGVGDVNEAITLHREALSLRPVGHNDRSLSLNNLANAIQARYQQFGYIGDINEAITLHQEAISLFPIGYSDRSHSLNNLANAIQTRYERFGDVNDINEAVTLHREALSLLPVDHNDRSRSLNNLANATRSRYERFGSVHDVDEAINLHREALSLRPVGHYDHSYSLNNLAIAIQTRYDRIGDVNDINEAVALHWDALSLFPVGHNDRSGSLCNLANAMQTRYDRVGNVNDINEAITLHREALSLLPLGRPDRSSSLINLATAIRTKCRRTGEVKDIHEAISLSHEALDLLPLGHNLRYAILALLGGSLILGVVQGGFDHNSSLRAIDEAQSLVNEAVTASSAPLASQLSLALYHGSISVYETGFRISMHLQSIKLLQRLMVVNPNIFSQQFYIHQHKDVASTMSAHALDAGSPETAAIVFDGGRSLLLGTIQRYRSPVEDLRQMNQELADNLQSVGSQLERLALLGESKESIPKFATELDFMLTVQRNLRERWNSLLDQIHALPGFKHFLTTPPFGELQAAASDGPVILLNAYKSRCDAIIIFPSGSPELIPLQDPVSLDSLHELYRELTTSWRQNQAKQRQVLLGIFRFLWEHVVSRVVDCIMSRGVKRGSRVWWCPASIFSLLPIHAAGMCNGQPDCNLSDVYISSYSPTISELIRARRPKPASLEPLESSSRLLFIGNSGRSIGPLSELQNVGTELAAIRKTVDDITSITAADATPDIVLKKIQQHPWAHFSCHGEVDTEDPTKSHFVLEDNARLHVKDILSVNLHNAEFAFLSACHSAAPGLALPDEGIHLSSAMMFAGFRSVVGTMWEMYDAEGPVISELFYQNLKKRGGRYTDAAVALHRTIRARCRLDAKQGTFRPERWAMLVHIGA